jgi:hypothetical protein
MQPATLTSIFGDLEANFFFKKSIFSIFVYPYVMARQSLDESLLYFTFEIFTNICCHPSFGVVTKKNNGYYT